MKVFYLTTNKINLRILKWFASLTWLALKMGWALGIWQQHSDAALVLCTVFAHKHSFVGNVGWHHILTMELDCFGNNVWAASGSRGSEIREIKKQPGPAAAQITFARLISGSLISEIHQFTHFHATPGEWKTSPWGMCLSSSRSPKAGSAHSREEGILLPYL